jgi:hypothetical protein
MADLQHIFLIAINYSHDVATAFLAASGASLWLLARNYPSEASPAAERYFLKIYRSITRIARDSLYYILIAGVPRVFFYLRYEWSDLAGDLQIVAVIIKHIVMFLLVGTGIYSWVLLGRRVKALQLSRGTPS